MNLLKTIPYLLVVVISITTLVTAVSDEFVTNSKHEEWNITSQFIDKNKASRDYFKLLSDVVTKRAGSVLTTLDKDIYQHLTPELVNFLSTNPRSAIETFIPFLNSKNHKQRILQQDKNGLKDFETCTQDLETFVNAVRVNLVWALRMVDAAGKPGPGIILENVRFIGDYDECIKTETDQKFGTRYCLTTFAIQRINQFKFKKPLGGQIGLCVPDSCDGFNFNVILNEYLYSTFGNDSIVALKSECQERDLTLSGKARVAIAILSVIATSVVLGTLYDILLVQGLWNRLLYGGDDEFLHAFGQQSFNRQESTHRSEYEPLVNNNKDTGPKQSTAGRLLLSFSIYHNTTKLLSTTPTSGSIDCINGIRFISMTWVVLGHSIIFGIGTMANVRPYLDMAYGRWTFQVISNALVAVDTFFALSGLLLVYLIMKGLDKTGPSSGFFGQMYFHRFWRLTPPYMLVLMTYVTLFNYSADGPVWPQTDDVYNGESWWTNLLYINNFVKEEKMCMGWSWYLANDMQFFIISPIIFLPIFYLGNIGLVVPFVLLLGNAMASGIITYMNNLAPILELFSNGTGDYFKMYYIKPYTRIGSYIVGMVTGYLLYKYDCKARIPEPIVVLGWMLASAMALAVQYGMFEHSNGHPVTTEVAALYNSLHRISWGLAVCWVIFACANGYGGSRSNFRILELVERATSKGFINTVLSWKALAPLSRLTCVYLVHPLVISFHFDSQRRLVNLDNNNVVFSFLGILLMSYMVGYVASMAFEAPMIGIEKAFKKQRS